MNDADAADALAEAMRCDWGRLTALLVRRTGRVDLAEDALADACEAAVRTWPRDGRPTNPTGWLMTVASRRLIDALRAENTARSRSDELLRQAEDTEHRHSRRMDEALLALMLLQHARRDARVVGGTLVLLADQDRSRWHHDEIAEGLGLLDHPALASPLSAIATSYLLQAHIAAEHARTASADDTDWSRIVRRYDELLKVAPSPAARLARAVAVAEADGAVAGLAALEEVDLPSTHRISTVRAELLRRSGDLRSARTAYDEAIAHCDNPVERAHLEGRRAELAE